MTSTEMEKILDGSPYHVGIVVDDVAQAMQRYGRLFGVEWADRMGGEIPVQLRGRTRTVKFDAVYSRSGPVRIELTLREPGTLWDTGATVHHVGFWSDDVVGQSEQLAAAGCPVEALLFPIPGSDVPSVAYCRGPEGLFVELVSSDMRAGMESQWS